MKIKKNTLIIILVAVIAAIAGAAGWYAYNESQKSSFERGAERTVKKSKEFGKDVSKSTKKLFK